MRDSASPRNRQNGCVGTIIDYLAASRSNTEFLDFFYVSSVLRGFTALRYQRNSKTFNTEGTEDTEKTNPSLWFLAVDAFFKRVRSLLCYLRVAPEG